ncbi:MAG: CotH kinase family protein [Polyangiales bacterium]
MSEAAIAADDDPWSSGFWDAERALVSTQSRPTPPSGASTPTAPSNPAGVRAEPVDDAARGVFDQTKVQTYEITISPLDLGRINQRPSDETKVRATLRFNGQTYGPIAFRYKGSIGAFLAPCTSQQTPIGPSPGSKVGKCSAKLDFAEYDSKLRFFGLKKLNLHSMGHDPSMMKERLGYALYREMGVAAPRTMHARVVINGRLEGLFLAVEDVDGRFTKSRFEDGGDGNLYKEVWPMYDSSETYRQALETNEGGDVARMVAFKKAIDRGASSAVEWLDRRYMMSYLAVDRLILNDDGIMHWYCGAQQGNNERRGEGNHNYYWYEGRNIERFWLIPWDLDSSFKDDPGSFTHVATAWNAQNVSCTCRIAGGAPQRAPSCDPLIRILGGYRSFYDEAVSQLVRGPFSASAIDAKLNAWSSQIQPHVQAAAGVLDAPSTREWQSALSQLRGVINRSRTNRGFDY